MDEVTRPPRKEDLVKLCQELNRLEAKYIVIGGLAMASRRLMIKLKQGRRPKDQIDLQFLLQMDEPASH
jgi:hypothetical protein